MAQEETSGYGLSEEKQVVKLAAPDVHYLPDKPKANRRKIALIGAGGIVEYHLNNYRELGLNVVAISNRDAEKANKLAQQFYPEAEVYRDYREILAREDIEIVDVAIPVKPRMEIIEECL